jgi:ATP-dependent DNA helicase RecG
MANGQHMNRLLQGDVGSGKTMVAILCMLLAIDNGCQAALMAPTEILANQHFDAIARWLEQMGLTVRLLTGSTRKKMRNTIQQELTDGTLNVLVGTHALIEDKVAFRNLGLVIIDEQHRFGVAQRARLWKKYDILPHVLVMTATPIPRTLAMTIFGDLDVSIIDELPPGRKPIKTVHYFDSQRLRVHALLKQELTKGRQVYIVYPLIEESDKLSYKALTEGVESLAQVFPPPQYAIGVLHGQMKAAEKDLAMQYFVKGITHIMVATTVIEVGVNVPNASVMVIENAEKFGLSQLHQLRGRVGRGADESFCYLMTPFEITREGKKRIETMVNSNDGFEIAEMDLKLRGPGDLEGTQQSGLPIGLKVASLAKDGEILEKARHIAKLVVENDPQLLKPEHQLLRRGVDKLTPDKTMDWAEIS